MATPEERRAALAAYQDAKAAAQAMKTKPLPSPFARFAMNPWKPGLSAVDSPKEYENDQRRNELLRRLSEYAGPQPIQEFGADLGSDIIKYRKGEVDNTPFHKRGVMDVGAPLHTAMQYFQASAAIPLHLSKVAANQIYPDIHPDAEKNLAKSLNTLTMYGAENRGLVPKGTGTIVEDAFPVDEARASVPWDAGSDYVELAAAMASDEAQKKMDAAIPSGWQHYQGLGVPLPVAIPLGATHDMIADPYGAAFDVFRLAKAGLAGSAWKALGRDAALGYGPSVAPYAVEQADKMIDRLHGVRDGETALYYGR